jgi:hypothetical protein
MIEAGARMSDYAEMGIERQIILSQFTGWWSYGVDPARGNDFDLFKLG